MRYADIHEATEHNFDKFWLSNGESDLSHPLKGAIVFDLLHLLAYRGYDWQKSQFTEIQSASFLDHVCTEIGHCSNILDLEGKDVLLFRNNFV